MKPLIVAIGYEPREAVCFHVLSHSIMSRASGPVQIIPINISSLKGIYARPRSPQQSTDFTFARFLTPYLAQWNTSVFLDSDMLCLTDIYDLVAKAQEGPFCDVSVVKHDYVPSSARKFLNQEQTKYKCKNWSSVMVFHPFRSSVRHLTPEYVNTADPMALHQFHWAADVGEIPVEYNHLVGEYPYNPNAKIVHFTLGAPCFRQYQNCDYSELWFEELGRMTHCDDPILELSQCLPTSKSKTGSQTS